jgi:hypothetical protein
MGWPFAPSVADPAGSAPGTRALRPCFDTPADEAGGVAEAERILATEGSPLRSSRGSFEWYPGPSGARAVHFRGTCCLAWRTPEGAYCPTLTPERRDVLVGDWPAAGPG